MNLLLYSKLVCTFTHLYLTITLIPVLFRAKFDVDKEQRGLIPNWQIIRSIWYWWSVAKQMLFGTAILYVVLLC